LRYATPNLFDVGANNGAHESFEIVSEGDCRET
jgi:hypothetical protein